MLPRDTYDIIRTLHAAQVVLAMMKETASPLLPRSLAARPCDGVDEIDGCRTLTSFLLYLNYPPESHNQTHKAYHSILEACLLRELLVSKILQRMPKHPNSDQRTGTKEITAFVQRACAVLNVHCKPRWMGFIRKPQVDGLYKKRIFLRTAGFVQRRSLKQPRVFKEQGIL